LTQGEAWRIGHADKERFAMTPIDHAHQAMLAADESPEARLAFYGHVADTDLLVLLEREPAGAAIVPKVYDLADGPVVLGFDSEEKLAGFTGAVSAYAALPGRVIAAQLAGQGTGLGLNFGADSATLLSPEALIWLAGTLALKPAEANAVPLSFAAPEALPQALIAALGDRLARIGGIGGAAALLAAVVYRDGRQGHALAFLGASPGAQSALAQAVSEAVVFSGCAAEHAVDVTFLATDDPLARRMARVALRFDPPPAPAAPPARLAPGMDRSRPPRLRQGELRRGVGVI
jgi:SseB protein N-terminal domain